MRSMQAPIASRGITPARVLALLVIALLGLGLAYLRFSGGSRLSVPDGAQAGDLILEPCTYDTEDGGLAADCGTLVVPEDRADPQSRLIALPVVRIPARSGQPSEPIFRLEGGPGITNMSWRFASRFVGDHDFVLVGYRGVDGSERLECPEVSSALRRSTDLLSEESLQAYADGFGACARRFASDGVDVTNYGLVQQIDDLEAARVALGYERINLLSESAGTRTALVYAWRYPQSIHRSVMVGVNPPGHFLWDPGTFDEQIGRYAGICSADAECRARTDDLAASIRETAANMPDRWLIFPIAGDNARVFSFFGFMESTSEASPLSAPLTIDAWLAAAEGDASALWLQSAFPRFFQMPFVWGEYFAFASIDFAWARDYFAVEEPGQDTNLGYAGTAFAWGGGRAIEAWPAARETADYDRMQDSEVETLLISGALDTSTPPQAATNELLPYLPNGQQVVLPGFGHTLSIWLEQPEAGTHLINTYFASGTVDDSHYVSQSVDFTPGIAIGLMAKGIITIMLGLAVLTVVSLVGMMQRVRSHGGLGHKTSIAIRSAFVGVVGLGGWCLGGLVIMIANVAVPLESGWFTALSIAAPIGLVTHWAWVRSDWAIEVRYPGLGLALAGALFGAWLGLGVVTGMMAVGTAVVGAAITANLMLITYDIAAEGAQRRRMRPGDTAQLRHAASPSA